MIKKRVITIMLAGLIAISTNAFTMPVRASVDDAENNTDKISAFIDNMSTEDKVAQLFILTPEAMSDESSTTAVNASMEAFLEQYPVGGMICFEDNITSDTQITKLLSDVQGYNSYPMFFCTDEEGGGVTRLISKLGLADVGTARSIGDAGDTDAAYEAGATLGTYLKEYGFNVDFAPVADVSLADSTVINTRSYSTDAAVAADMVENVVKGIEDTNVSATLKHFPGHGSTSDDSHTGMATTTRTLDEMYETEFLPFESGIAAGADFVMMGHISAPNATPDGDIAPASLNSFFVTDILRDSLGFDGIVVTDALSMSAVTDYYTSGEAAVMAIKAGVDMLLMPEDFGEAYNAVLSAVKAGEITEDRIDESIARIFTVKYADAAGEAFAVYSDDDASLTFYCGDEPTEGSTYNGKTVAYCYDGFDVASYTESTVPWAGVAADVKSVATDESFSSARPKSTACWFNGFSSCIDMDLSNLNTSDVTDMKKMFKNCTALTSLDLSGFDTESVTSMASMFYFMSNLSDITFGDTFDTSLVTDMSSMFDSCRGLAKLDLSVFDTKNVTTMRYMFEYCSSLNDINVSSFDMKNVKRVDYMFKSCSSLTSLNLTGWDTAKVTDYAGFASDCTLLHDITLGDGCTLFTKSKAALVSQPQWYLKGDLISDNYLIGISGAGTYSTHSFDIQNFLWNDDCTACRAEFSCSYCGETAEAVCDVTSKTITEPTCVNNGDTLHTATCTFYGKEYSDTKGTTQEALGHDYAYSETVDPTCTKGGYDIYKCTRCGVTENRNKTSALGHDYKLSERIAAACTEGGYDIYACSRCSMKEERNKTTALGHDYIVTENGMIRKYTCSRCGYVKTEYIDGIFADASGVLHYYTNGETDKRYTGFAKNEDGIWYVENGDITLKKQGILKDTSGAVGEAGAWYYVIASKVQEDFTGLSNFSNENGWWYIKNGKVDFTHNGVDKNKNGWFYVTDGKVQFGFTGLSHYRNQYGWWYINSGEVTFNADTVAKNQNGWFYVTESKVQFGFTGLADHKNEYGWWYIKKGKVDFTRTGVEKNKNGWWRVEGGKVNFGFTGKASNRYGTWNIVNGKVVF